MLTSVQRPGFTSFGNLANVLAKITNYLHLALPQSDLNNFSSRLIQANSFFYLMLLLIKGNDKLEAVFAFPGVIRFCLRDHLL